MVSLVSSIKSKAKREKIIYKRIATINSKISFNQDITRNCDILLPHTLSLNETFQIPALFISCHSIFLNKDLTLIVQAEKKLIVAILLPKPPKCYDWRHEKLHLAFCYSVIMCLGSDVEPVIIFFSIPKG